jgi:hypothetical protein
LEDVFPAYGKFTFEEDVYELAPEFGRFGQIGQTAVVKLLKRQF